MGKIIMDNKSDLPDDVALSLVANVVRGGRISNNGKQYCYGATFKINGVNYGVFSDLNKTSDKFTVIKG